MEKLEKELEGKQVGDLCSALLSMKNVNECKAFLRDVMTFEEMLEIARRFEVAKLLDKKVSFRAIEKKTQMSSTTIARINYWLNHGMGGYRIALQRLKKINKSYEKIIKKTTNRGNGCSGK